MFILGISAYYHDSAAALISDGNIIAAAEEERFTRIKHDKSFPKNSIIFCLEEANITIDQVDYVVFYDKPLLKFERIIESVLWSVPFGLSYFISFATEWLGQGKISLRRTIQKELASLFSKKNYKDLKIMFSEHHRSHAASAFFPSPFSEAVILCVDGVGEWATTTCWLAKENKIKPLWQIDFPHSLGLLYSAFTSYLGFEVNDGEYKVMGLAPYGRPIYEDKIKNNLINIKDDGTFRLNMEYFPFTKELQMTNKKFEDLFGESRRSSKDSITEFHKNIACSVQKVLEEVMIKLAVTIKNETQVENLCLAGGVALNCVANEKLKETNLFKNIWIQPAAGDSGGALGAALSMWYEFLCYPRIANKDDEMRGALLGPSFSNEKIKTTLEQAGAIYEFLEENSLLDRITEDLKEQKVVGWFQGKMEFGPRALGSRSIIADPRSSEMQSILNQKIKYRESFRPFAPAVLEEHAEEYFNLSGKSPYMLFTAQVKSRSLKATTHIDNSARVQTVNAVSNPLFYKLIQRFKEKTGCPIIINTSFNIRGEPIVCTPNDAFKCFMNTDMDSLVLGSFYLEKIKQNQNEKWKYTTPQLKPENNQIIKYLKLKRNYQIDELGLKKFGITIGLLIPTMFILILPLIGKAKVHFESLFVSAVLVGLAFLYPQSLRSVHFYWVSFGELMGRLKSKVFLTAVYFILFVPYGLIIRLFINSQINDKLDNLKISYRQKQNESYEETIKRMRFPI